MLDFNLIILFPKSLLQINSGTQQIVNGVNYQFNADLLDILSRKKTCDITLYKGMRKNQITIKCPKKRAITKSVFL